MHTHLYTNSNRSSQLIWTCGDTTTSHRRWNSGLKPTPSMYGFVHMLSSTSLVPSPHPKNRERGLVAFSCIFCWPLPLKILRSQSDCQMKPCGMWSRHMCTRPKVLTMQYGRVARNVIICVSCRLWLKSESTVYPCGLSRQTPWSSGLDRDQLRQCVRICV